MFQHSKFHLIELQQYENTYGNMPLIVLHRSIWWWQNFEHWNVMDI